MANASTLTIGARPAAAAIPKEVLHAGAGKVPAEYPRTPAVTASPYREVKDGQRRRDPAYGRRSNEQDRSEVTRARAPLQPITCDGCCSIIGRTKS